MRGMDSSRERNMSSFTLYQQKMLVRIEIFFFQFKANEKWLAVIWRMIELRSNVSFDFRFRFVWTKRFYEKYEKKFAWISAFFFCAYFKFRSFAGRTAIRLLTANKKQIIMIFCECYLFGGRRFSVFSYFHFRSYIACIHWKRINQREKWKTIEMQRNSLAMTSFGTRMCMIEISREFELKKRKKTRTNKRYNFSVNMKWDCLTGWHSGRSARHEKGHSNQWKCIPCLNKWTKWANISFSMNQIIIFFLL